MKKEVKIPSQVSVVLAVLFALFLFSFAVADQQVRHSSGINSSSMNQSVSALVNVSVNITDTAAAGNVSSVNITLPGNLTFVAGTNQTSAAAPTNNFTNTSTVLSWRNNTSNGLVLGATTRFFSFNVTASANPGLYQINATVVNASGPYNHTINFTINDTAAPTSVVIQNFLNASQTNTSVTAIPINVSVADNGFIGTISVRVSNSTNNIINISNITFGNNYNQGDTNRSATTFQINVSGLADGNYTINATVNDTAANYPTENGSSANSNVSRNAVLVVDTTAPTVTLTASETTVSTLTIAVAVVDATSGSKQCTVSRGTASITGTGKTQTITETGLSCGSAYSYGVTCTDLAGNTGSKTESFSTGGCAGGTTTGGTTGGTTITPTTWTATKVITSTDASSGYTAELGSKERVQLPVQGVAVVEQHSVGVVNVTGNSVVIEVASTVQRVTMNVGETKKFEVTNDDYYDLSVKVNSITNGKASVTVLAVHEQMPAAPAEQPAQGAGETGTGGAGTGKKSSSAMTWTIVIIVLVIIIALVAYFTMRKKQ